MTEPTHVDTSRPSMDEVLMHIAHAMSARGTCPYAQVGVIVARDGRILVSGYNGVSAGMPHCDHGPRYPNEPVIPCDAVHAEANAVAYAARDGIALHGGTMYTMIAPCLKCAQLVIGAGIVRVVAAQEYRDPAGVYLLNAAGVWCDFI
jgi:dCMP deaminase